MRAIFSVHERAIFTSVRFSGEWKPLCSQGEIPCLCGGSRSAKMRLEQLVASRNIPLLPTSPHPALFGDPSALPFPLFIRFCCWKSTGSGTEPRPLTKPERFSVPFKSSTTRLDCLRVLAEIKIAHRDVIPERRFFPVRDGTENTLPGPHVNWGEGIRAEHPSASLPPRTKRAHSCRTPSATAPPPNHARNSPARDPSTRRAHPHKALRGDEKEKGNVCFPLLLLLNA